MALASNDPEKEWNYINNYPLMHHVGYGLFSHIAMNAALDIRKYIDDKEPYSNDFAKLRQILYKTLLPNKEKNKLLPHSTEGLGKREIDNYLSTGRYLQQVLEHHKEQESKTYKRETPYQLKEGITTTGEMANDLARVITIITNDLEDLSKTPKENLENLVSLCLSFNTISHYHERENRNYLAA